MDKKDVIRILEEIAVLLELKGENPFKIRAYHNAAHSLLNLEDSLEKRVKEKTLTEIEGIGAHISEKITDLMTKGRLPYYEKLKKSTPSGLLEMMQVHGLGAKKIKSLYEKLKIKSLKELKKACTDGRVAKLRGFGEKTQENILNALGHSESYGKRHLWIEAIEIATPIVQGLRKLKDVKKVEVAGSLRRKLETVGDLDFLVASSKPGPIMEWFTKHPSVEKIIAKGETKSSVRLQDGIQADLRIVSENEFGFALTYFTGSKEHNIKIRKLALKKGWSLSEWGMVPVKPKAREPFPTQKAVTEEDLYKALGLSYIQPELREDMGEVEAAAKNKLPTLIQEKEIRGTFHNHTTASDGRSTLEEMVAAAEKLKWEYIGISDHSPSSFQANGLSKEQLFEQLSKIAKLNKSKKYKPYIFTGTECDILTNGKLDYPDEVLKKLDYVVISVHSSFQQDEKTMTKRIIKAIEHPYTTMLGHATGRLLLKRKPYAVNLSKVIDACIANGKIMELNANPQRLDMDWRLWHAASEKGLICCINTDAHSTNHLEFFRLGVYAAKKGWLEKKHILNTRSLKEVQAILKKIQAG